MFPPRTKTNKEQRKETYSSSESSSSSSLLSRIASEDMEARRLCSNCSSSDSSSWPSKEISNSILSGVFLAFSRGSSGTWRGAAGEEKKSQTSVKCASEHTVASALPYRQVDLSSFQRVLPSALCSASFLPSFQSDRHVVLLCWPVECMMIQVWFSIQMAVICPTS